MRLRPSRVLLIAMALSMLVGLSGGNDTTADNATMDTSTDTTNTTSRSDRPTDVAEVATTRGSQLGVGTIVGLVLAVIFIVVLGILAAVLFFGYQRIFHRDMYCDQVSISGEPHDMLDRLASGKGSVDLAGLKKERAKIEAMQKKRGLGGRPSSDMLRFLYMIPDEKREKEDEKRGIVTKIADCRASKIPIRRDTQVKLYEKQGQQTSLHMSRLFDFYGNTILLSQAPMPHQFVDQWLAIWQEQVGVVVWIGPLEEKGKPKIEPYIPMESSAVLTIGTFVIQNTCKIVATQNEYVTYVVSVTRGQETRELEFIHIEMWPDEMPSQDDLIKLAEAIAHVRVQQRTKSKDANLPLPGFLAHCSVGCERSAAFVAAYIGNQMWIGSKRMNVLGILQFVRRHRWKAFGLGEPDVQVRIVYRVIEIIAMRYADHAVCAVKLSPKKRMLGMPPTISASTPV